MFLWLKTLYRKRAVTWPFIFYTIIWTLSSIPPPLISNLLTKKLIVILQIFIKNKYAKKLFLQGFS